MRTRGGTNEKTLEIEEVDRSVDHVTIEFDRSEFMNNIVVILRLYHDERRRDKKEEKKSV